MKLNEYAKYIDHTYLKADATSLTIDTLVKEAKEYGFKTVCVNSGWVSYAAELTKGSKVGITAVVGFPLGAVITDAKANEAKDAIKAGATEIDMVIHIGKMKDHDYNYVLEDIKAVKKAIGKHTLKVIIECALLTEGEIVKATELVLQSGAEFVKTSTGFSTRGATFEDIELMKKVVGNDIEIKAAGGVKTSDDMKKMIELGATRIGTSSGVALVSGSKSGEGY